MNFGNNTQAPQEQFSPWQSPGGGQPGVGSPFGNPAYSGGGNPLGGGANPAYRNAFNASYGFGIPSNGAQPPAPTPGSNDSMQSILDLIKQMGQPTSNQPGGVPNGTGANQAAPTAPTPPPTPAPTLQQIAEQFGIKAAPPYDWQHFGQPQPPSAEQLTGYLGTQHGWHAGDTASYGSANLPPQPPANTGLTWIHSGAANQFELVPVGSDQARKEAMQWPTTKGFTPQAIADKKQEDAMLLAAGKTQHKLGLMMPQGGWSKSQLQALADGRNPLASVPSKASIPPKFR